MATQVAPALGWQPGTGATPLAAVDTPSAVT
jgi:hypothetical protein